MKTVIALAVWSIASIAMAAPHAAPAHGAEPAAHGGEHGGGIEWVTPLFDSKGKIGLLWMLINFAALMWLLEKLLFSKLRARTAVKHDAIKSELDKAKSARKEAETVLADVRGKLDGLDKTVAEILAEAKSRAEADRKRVLEHAQAEAARIEAAAKASAERDAESRRRQLETEIVDRAIARAEELIRARIDVMDQKRMVDEFVAQVPKADLGAASSGGAS
ncbi:MAG TPA: ATP synthase F0 subunit B [Nannocystaceae bacterium]|nr:ATP synthase F0 subunit B [Nannocystaceae bacterium]